MLPHEIFREVSRGSGGLAEAAVAQHDTRPLELGLDPEALDVALHAAGGVPELVLDLEHGARLDQHLVVREAVAELLRRGAVLVPADDLAQPAEVRGEPLLLKLPDRSRLGAGRRPSAGDVLAVRGRLAELSDFDETQFAELARRARSGDDRSPRARPEEQAELHVWSVLTVDVVDGRIQTVRIVRNPDKLAHL